ncbi:c-type cytochrome [Paracoccus shanxieyensis]|uniref:C-type cytochrome n=1 Tax=Paracoccus shanxieyensis TaxID=2675752 RepID=A0A6L6J0R7_9RHOB|nr:c-type cytochrome [Paracoccus shanxieyensis]MTH64850.1 c-type cytochrome [Paracoccus shanxieyensis]MTH87917.1 c-type cytochrome [Paracoccus shanxieyensis]
MKHVIATLAGLAVLGAIAGLAVVFFGLFDTSARRGHWAITDWAMHTTFENAVKWRAPAASEVPPDLDDPALIELGARHYASACVTCHATPGRDADATIAAMVPHPPQIQQAVKPWQPQHLHWIVDQGVKMTGMPAWPAEGRKDEVWAVVAFLNAVRDGMTAEDYTALTQTGEQGYCASCHGPDGTSRAPRLDILSPDYIAASLAAYRSGARASGIMQHAASKLPATADARLASAMADLPAPPRPAVTGDADAGAVLADQGAGEVPSCLACHGPQNRNPLIPSLDGQGQSYLAAQLRLWRDGHRGGAARAPLMAQAAQQLTDDQIAALAAYFAMR